MTELSIDAAKSHLRIETRAKGMLAKLAHDLSIEGAGPKGAARIEGDKLAFDLEIPVAALRVAGVRKGGRVETSVLSSSDLADIHKKLRDDVLAGSPSVRVSASGAAPADDAKDATFELVVKAGRGEQRVRTKVAVKREGERTIVTGMATVSLEALRIPPVKGPLGAFRVDDAIEVHAHVEMVAAS
jgi:hypothetical protein